MSRWRGRYAPAALLHAPRDHDNFGSRAAFGRLALLRTQILPILFAQQLPDVAKFAGALQPFSAIHHHDFAVDLRAAIADEKSSEIRKLLERPKTPQRNPVNRVSL